MSSLTVTHVRVTHEELVEKRGAYFRFLKLCYAISDKPAQRARTTRLMNVRSHAPPPGKDTNDDVAAGGDALQPINIGHVTAAGGQARAT